jgi:hypothetical protein
MQVVYDIIPAHIGAVDLFKSATLHLRVK